MINEQDSARMADACRLLPEPVGNYLVDDYLTNLVATVVDFRTHTTTVERALGHFANCVRPGLGSVADLVQLMARWPSDQAGNTALARHLWGYSLSARAQMLRDLVAYFSTIGVIDQGSLRNWAERATFGADFQGRVRGLGLAVFQWLVMRQGIDTVKPDVHVHRFAAGVLGRQLSDTDVVDVVVAAAHRLGRPAHRIDWAIWEAGRRGASGAGPNHHQEEQPAPATSVKPLLAASPPDGGPVSFVDDDAGYLAWLGTHPGGYVLNADRTPSARYVVLHRATCHTMKPQGDTDNRSWTVVYSKACAMSAQDLGDWARARAGAWPSACGRCRPGI